MRAFVVKNFIMNFWQERSTLFLPAISWLRFYVYEIWSSLIDLLKKQIILKQLW